MGETTPKTILPMLHSDLVPQEIICNKKRIVLVPLQFLLEGVALKVHGSRQNIVRLQNIKNVNTLFDHGLGLGQIQERRGCWGGPSPEVSCTTGCLFSLVPPKKVKVPKT